MKKIKKAQKGTYIPRKSSEEVPTRQYVLPIQGPGYTDQIIGSGKPWENKPMYLPQGQQTQEVARTAAPRRSTINKVGMIARNPMTALQYKAQGQDIPDYLEYGEKNKFDNAIDVINPLTYTDAIGRTVTAQNFRDPNQSFGEALGRTALDVGMVTGLGKSVYNDLVPTHNVGLLKAESENISNQGIRFNQKFPDKTIIGKINNEGKFAPDLQYQGSNTYQQIPKERLQNTNLNLSSELQQEIQDRFTNWQSYRNDLTTEIGKYKPGQAPWLKPGESYTATSGRIYTNDAGHSQNLRDVIGREENFANHYRQKVGIDVQKLRDNNPVNPLLFSGALANKVDNNQQSTTDTIPTLPTQWQSNNQNIPMPQDTPQFNKRVKETTKQQSKQQSSEEYKKPEVQVQWLHSHNGQEPILDSAKQYQKLQQGGAVIRSGFFPERQGWEPANTPPVSVEGYRSNSPDRHEPFLNIPSSNISMKGVPHRVLGIDNTGKQILMVPGQDYQFPGTQVTEYPIRGKMQSGGWLPKAQNGMNGVKKQNPPIYTNDRNDPKDYAKYLKAHNDSVTAYNIYNDDYNNTQKSGTALTIKGVTKVNSNPTYIPYDKNNKDLRRAAMISGVENEDPIGVYKYSEPGLLNFEHVWLPRYAKPADLIPPPEISTYGNSNANTARGIHGELTWKHPKKDNIQQLPQSQLQQLPVQDNQYNPQQVNTGMEDYHPFGNYIQEPGYGQQRIVNGNVDIPKQKNGGWLQKYQPGGNIGYTNMSTRTQPTVNAPVVPAPTVGEQWYRDHPQQHVGPAPVYNTPGEQRNHEYFQNKMNNQADDERANREFAGKLKAPSELAEKIMDAGTVAEGAGMAAKLLKKGIQNLTKQELVTLYRIQGKGAKTTEQLVAEGQYPTWGAKNPEHLANKANQEKYFGQWFTKDKKDLDWYRGDREFTDGNSEIIELNIPKKELNKYQNYDKALSRAPDKEYVIPHDVQAKYRKGQQSAEGNFPINTIKGAKGNTPMPSVTEIPELNKEQKILESFGVNPREINKPSNIYQGSLGNKYQFESHVPNNPNGKSVYTDIPNTFTQGSYDPNSPVVSGKDMENMMNEKLKTGYGIKKIPDNITVQYEKGNPYTSVSEPKHSFRINVNGRGTGYIGLNKELPEEHMLPGVDHPVYRKVADYPYDFITGNGKTYDYLKGSGVSGEVNKALTDVLQESGKGHLYSSDTHSLEGYNRWENLVKKGKADRLKDAGIKMEEDPFADEDVKTSHSAYRLKKMGGVIKKQSNWLSKY